MHTAFKEGCKMWFSGILPKMKVSPCYQVVRSLPMALALLINSHEN